MSVAYQWFLFSAFALFHPAVDIYTTPEHSNCYNNRTMSEDFTLLFVLTLWADHVTIIFCSSCGCLWERVTVKTRFYPPIKDSLFLSSLTFSVVLNVPCTHSDQILTQFSTVYCYQIQLWQILASWTSGLQKQNIVVHLSGDGDLQSEI